MKLIILILMDCLFNKHIPKSSEHVHIIRPASMTTCLSDINIGKTFVNGMAWKYDRDSYDRKKLRPRITKRHYEMMVDEINKELQEYWPCFCCFWAGYLFSPCTLGLSFLCPRACVNEARARVDRRIRYFNKTCLMKADMQLELKVECSTSWLELRLTPYFSNDMGPD